MIHYLIEDKGVVFMQYIIKYIDLGNEMNYLEIKIGKKIILFINTKFYSSL